MIFKLARGRKVSGEQQRQQSVYARWSVARAFPPVPFKSKSSRP